MAYNQIHFRAEFTPPLRLRLILAFGITCTWIGTSVISLKEEGEGIKVIGIRFLVGAAVSIGLGFLAKYFMLIKYILRQFLYRRKPEEDKYSGSFPETYVAMLSDLEGMKLVESTQQCQG